MMSQQSTPISALPGNTSTPPGWRSEWSVEHQRYYYVNISTNESTWTIPTAPPPSLARKPVPSPAQSNQMENQPAVHANQTSTGNHISSPPQTQFQQQTVGYFPPPPANAQYQPPQAIQQQVHTSTPMIPPVHSQTESARQHYPAQQYPPPSKQMLYHPQQQNSYAQPATHFTQQYTPPQTPSPYQPQQINYSQPATQTIHQYTAPPTPGGYQPQLQPQPQRNFTQQTSPYTQPQFSHPVSNMPQHGQQNNFSQPMLQSQHQARKPSVGMMGKLGSKLGQLQKSAGSGASQPALKKWGTRAALGLGALGALALGVDAVDGGIFDGADEAAGMDSGMAGDVGAGMDSTAVDAAYAQAAMEQQGRENALMLLDPVGTEYTTVTSPGLI